MYEVIRNINGREYRYRQESYRVPGQKNPKTRSVYLGPVDGGIRKRKGLIASALDVVREAAMSPKAWDEKPEVEAKRLVDESEAYARRDRVNGLLSGKSITLSELNEVADVQRSGILDAVPGGAHHDAGDQEKTSPGEGEAEGPKDQDAGEAAAS